MVLAMKHRDLLVTDAGEWRVCKPSREWDLLRTPYRFHRFLTEVEEVLSEAIDETDCLPQLWLLVRRLITNSYWIQTQTTPVNPETGTGVIMLYDEIGYPLTVQIAKTEPGTRTTIHNHGNWGIVALLKGEEKNMLWKRIQDPKFPNRIEPTAEVTLLPGDIITFSIYGETYHSKRFEFDPVAHTAKNF
jgi:predicted metal-dependent enzyme (double-stranded beta helix superfamily)